MLKHILFIFMFGLLLVSTYFFYFRQPIEDIYIQYSFRDVVLIIIGCILFITLILFTTIFQEKVR